MQFNTEGVGRVENLLHFQPTELSDGQDTFGIFGIVVLHGLLDQERLKQVSGELRETSAC